MSNERSPRGDCSTTMGTRGMKGLLSATVWLRVVLHGSIATMELHEELGAVRRETVLDAPRDAVWELVASPEGLERWLADDVELDAVAPGEGGSDSDEDGAVRLVTVEEVQDGRRVALSWCPEDGDPS